MEKSKAKYKECGLGSTQSSTLPLQNHQTMHSVTPVNSYELVLLLPQCIALLPGVTRGTASPYSHKSNNPKARQTN